MYSQSLVCSWWLVMCFFFKQKTAYEMRISDWSSDVCSSDLLSLAVKQYSRGSAMRPRRFRSLVSAFAISAGLGLAVGLAAVAPDAAAQDGKTVLRFVPHAGLRITDPIMTTAYISRNHGYMIYDTLFSVKIGRAHV